MNTARAILNGNQETKKESRHIATELPTMTRTRALAIFGIFLLCSSAFAGSNEEKTTGTDVAQYDKTIGDTRVVLLAISSVQVLTSKSSKNNETNTTYLELTFLTEHIGTNSFSTPAEGSVILYLQDNEHKESMLNPEIEKSIFINGSVCNQLPFTNLRVTDAKACHSSRVFLHGLSYPAGARANCVIQEGFDGHLTDFRFNDILLPCSVIDAEKVHQ
jgi:hypothetical protein